MRTNLTIEDLGDLLDRPLIAVLATLRMDGTVLLSPVYHEWRDGGFNIWVEQQNVKARHLRRDPRATILVAESDPPLRAVEVRGLARLTGKSPASATARQRTEQRVIGGLAGDGGYAAGARVTVNPRASSWRMWLRAFLSLSMRLA
jgi:PPOX class probable F420-dependent enzyme